MCKRTKNDSIFAPYTVFYEQEKTKCKIIINNLITNSGLIDKAKIVSYYVINM